MPGVTFNHEVTRDSEFIGRSDSNRDDSRRSRDDSRKDDDDCDSNLSHDFRLRYGSEKTTTSGMGYKAVGRLSRWEGGADGPYQNSERETNVKNMVEAERLSIGEFLRLFLRPTYDFTEVTIQDIKRVKIMHDRFLKDAQHNFNYGTLLVIASVIAAVGLGSNSSASIIASMLVSPLMGPVTAIAYGISIGDYKMVRMGLMTEITSLMVCIVIGMVSCSIMKALPIGESMPGQEMTGRGTMTNFYCGIPIAFFSGLGVAVGLLDSQTNSLVGVAISASLLPPAVNAGMLWVLFEETKNYSHDGVMSLCLTIMNIAVIIIAAMFMFHLKETLPIEKSIFWSDLGVARKIYHNVAFVPIFQQAPNDHEIQKRVTRFFPRASAMALESNPNWDKGMRNLKDTTSGSLLNDSLRSHNGDCELLPCISERSSGTAG